MTTVTPTTLTLPLPFTPRMAELFYEHLDSEAVVFFEGIETITEDLEDERDYYNATLAEIAEYADDLDEAPENKKIRDRIIAECKKHIAGAEAILKKMEETNTAWVVYRRVGFEALAAEGKIYAYYATEEEAITATIHYKLQGCWEATMEDIAHEEAEQAKLKPEATP